MAKMFYTIEEAAGKLGISPDQVKEMAEDGKLQQFRDRDKLMFKCEQIDEMAASGSYGSGADTIDLTAETESGGLGGSNAGATATGISVFDTDEIAMADPMAQTQVTTPAVAKNANEESELTLESVGSGSGLLDLTHEPDETSLGAMALLDDMGGEESGTDSSVAASSTSNAGSRPTESGMIGSSDTSLLDAIEGESDSLAGEMEPAGMGAGGGVAYVMEEARDPTWDAWGSATLIGVFAVLIITLAVTLTGMQGIILKLTEFLSMDQPGTASAKPDFNTLMMWTMVMLGSCIVLGIIGLFIGRSVAKKAG